MRKLAADAVIFEHGKVLLVRRAFEPFKGMWCLPGGHIEDGETLEQTAIREAKEETGVDVTIQHLIGVFSDPKRDPRGVVSVAFSAVPVGGQIMLNKEVQEIKWFPLTELPELASDHKKIIEKFLGYGSISN